MIYSSSRSNKRHCIILYVHPRSSPKTIEHYRYKALPSLHKLEGMVRVKTVEEFLLKLATFSEAGAQSVGGKEWRAEINPKKCWRKKRRKKEEDEEEERAMVVVEIVIMMSKKEN